MRVLLVIRDRRGDGEAIVEAVTENDSAERLRALVVVARVRDTEVAGECRLLEIERAARTQIDDAAQAAFDLRSKRRFEHIEAAEQFGRYAFERLRTLEVAFADFVDFEA